MNKHDSRFSTLEIQEPFTPNHDKIVTFLITTI